MKQLICITMLILLPFMAFAQEYTLTLKSSREAIRCDVLGSANGYLYYQTPTASMVVVPLSSVKSLYLGRTDIAPRLLSGNNNPFNPSVYPFFPGVSDSLLTANNSAYTQQQIVNELRGIKNTLQVMVAFTIASAAALIYSASKAGK